MYKYRKRKIYAEMCAIKNSQQKCHLPPQLLKPPPLLLAYIKDHMPHLYSRDKIKNNTLIVLPLFRKKEPFRVAYIRIQWSDSFLSRNGGSTNEGRPEFMCRCVYRNNVVAYRLFATISLHYSDLDNKSGSRLTAGRPHGEFRTRLLCGFSRQNLMSGDTDINRYRMEKILPLFKTRVFNGA